MIVVICDTRFVIAKYFLQKIQKYFLIALLENILRLFNAEKRNK